jgi:threonine dehydrogenase-like Zn-dependent dehydrogenase
LSDVLATSYHCVVDTGVKEGDVVAIWGAGPIGQMCADYAFLEGASRVIMIDSVQWRLEFIKSKLPKIEYINFTELASGETVVSKLKEMVKEGPDVALECAAGEYAKSIANKLEMAAGLQTDTAELINEMIMSVKSFGRCGVTGVYVGYANHFNVGALMERGVRLIGNGQAPVWLYWEKLLKMIQDGTIEPLKMVTHRVDISEIDKVYYKFDKKEDNIQKVFISTKFSDPPAPGAPQLTTY